MFSVTKTGKFFEVSGTLAGEAFSAAYRTQREAEYNADRLTKIEADNALWNTTVVSSRRAGVLEYLASRAARPSALQMGFGF